MKKGWTEVAFSEVFNDVTTGQPKTKTSEFLANGVIPIVDQGRQLVGGFTNDATARCTLPLPLIAFGDHTKAIKYIDFDFGVGADGVKLLQAQEGIDPRYGYHFLRSARLTDGGYDRHFKYLKRLSVPRPSLDEQRRIAAILDQADELRAKRRAAIAHLDSLTEAIFLDMFGDPVSNPMSWPVTSIRDLAESLTYGSSEKALASGRIPVLRMGNLTSTGRIITGDLKYVDEAKDKHLLEPGDLVFNRTNSAELVGKTAVFNESGTWAYAGYLVRLRLTGSAEPTYVGAFMNLPSTKLKLRSMCKSIVGMANINAKELGTIRLPVPPTAAQRAFAQAADAMENERLRAVSALTHLDTLFASLQARAFAGEL